MAVQDVQAVQQLEILYQLPRRLYSPEPMLPAINGLPARQWLLTIFDRMQYDVDLLIMLMADNDRPYMFFWVGFLVQMRSKKGLFVFLDLSLLVILNKNANYNEAELAQQAKGRHSEKFLFVQV